MKRIDFTARAGNDLNLILEYYGEIAPAAGKNIIGRIGESLERLPGLPNVGKATNRESVRCLIVQGLPYKIFYTILPDRIIILSIFQTSRNPSDEP